MIAASIPEAVNSIISGDRLVTKTWDAESPFCSPIQGTSQNLPTKNRDIRSPRGDIELYEVTRTFRPLATERRIENHNDIPHIAVDVQMRFPLPLVSKSCEVSEKTDRNVFKRHRKKSVKRQSHPPLRMSPSIPQAFPKGISHCKDKHNAGKIKC